MPAIPTWQVASFLLGGGAAFVAHAGKAGARTLVNASPEPFSNIAVSTAEDVATGGLLALAIANPIAAALIAAILVVLSLWLVLAARRLLRAHGWIEPNARVTVIRARRTNMPLANSPLVERIARVLAGLALSKNANGDDASARATSTSAGPITAMTSRSQCCASCASPIHRWPRPATPRPGRKWSTQRSTKSERPRPRESAPRPALDACRLRPRLKPVVRRRLGAQRRSARDPRQLRRRRRRGAMGRQRLPAAAVGAAAARRSARRSLRPPPAADHRHRPVRRRLAGLRARSKPRDPARRARRAGRRRGSAPAQQPRLAQRRLSRRKARPRGRHLGRGGRRRGSGRAADRRLAGRPCRLAVDLLHQPAARRRRGPARPPLRHRKPAIDGAGPHRLCRRLARHRRASAGRPTA